MKSTEQSERETYRAIVFGQGGSELLLARATGGFLLPSVEIPRWQRIAENLTVAMKNDWGHEVVCLFSRSAVVPSGSPIGCNYQVMESYGAVAKSSQRAEWVRVASLSEPAFADPADYIAVQRSLAECTKSSGGEAPAPFAKLGWLEELQMWIKEAIAPLGLQLTGSFAQLNASPSFSLVRFETTGPAIWFKAVGRPNLHEFPITLVLAELFPQYLPPILAARPEWNGWLAVEAEGTNLGEAVEIALWNRAAATLARLQIDSIKKACQLLDTGARDLRVQKLRNMVHPFLEVMGELMGRKTKASPRILNRGELALLAERTQDALDSFRELDIPDSLGHLDLNPGNVIVSQFGSIFLDWAEAYVGPPFLSLEYLLEHYSRTANEDAALRDKIVKSYYTPWEQLLSADVITEAHALGPLLAVFAYASGSDTWTDVERLRNPQIAGYFRSLTRRMWREANQLSEAISSRGISNFAGSRRPCGRSR